MHHQKSRKRRNSGNILRERAEKLMKLEVSHFQIDFQSISCHGFFYYCASF